MAAWRSSGRGGAFDEGKADGRNTPVITGLSCRNVEYHAKFPVACGLDACAVDVNCT